MSEPLFLTTFCVNDERGNFRRRCRGIDIGSMLLSLECHFVDWSPRFTIVELGPCHAHGFRMHRQEFRPSRYRAWVGNILWDGWWLTAADCARLANACRAARAGGENVWQPDCGDADLFEQWTDGDAYTARDFLKHSALAGKL